MFHQFKDFLLFLFHPEVTHSCEDFHRCKDLWHWDDKWRPLGTCQYYQFIRIPIDMYIISSDSQVWSFPYMGTQHLHVNRSCAWCNLNTHLYLSAYLVHPSNTWKLLDVLPWQSCIASRCSGPLCPDTLRRGFHLPLPIRKMSTYFPWMGSAQNERRRTSAQRPSSPIAVCRFHILWIFNKNCPCLSCASR